MVSCALQLDLCPLASLAKASYKGAQDISNADIVGVLSIGELAYTVMICNQRFRDFSRITKDGRLFVENKLPYVALAVIYSSMSQRY